MAAKEFIYDKRYLNIFEVLMVECYYLAIHS